MNKEYREITREEYEAWLGNPVTEDFIEKVKELRSGSFEEQDCEVVMDNPASTAMWAAHSKGYRAGLDALLNMNFEEGGDDD